jgi:replicative DNA helicase
VSEQNDNKPLGPETAAYAAMTELILLGLMVRHPEKILESRTELRPEWFFLHRKAYDFVHAVADHYQQRGLPVSFNIATLMSLAESGAIGKIGDWIVREGREQFDRISIHIAPRLDLASWPSLVVTLREAAAKVYAHRVASGFAQTALQAPAAALPDLSAQCAAKLHRIATGGLGASTLTIGDEAGMILERAEMAKDRPWLNRIACPMFPAIMDALGGGLARNSLSLLSARSKVGKSALLNQLGIGFAQASVPVLFLDSEMLQGEQVARSLALLSGVPDAVIESGRMTDHQRSNVTAAKDVLVRLSPMFEHVQIGGKLVGEVIAEIHAFRRRVGSEIINVNGKVTELLKPCVVIYDWLQIPSGSSGRGTQEWQQLGYLASGLKQCANELQIPIVAACQQSKGAINLTDEEAKYGESFIGGSDRLLQYCTSACSLWPISPAMREAMETRFGPDGPCFTHLLRIDRQRAGQENRTGIPLLYNGAIKRMVEITEPAVLDFVRTFKTPTKRAAKPAPLPAAIPQSLLSL